VNLVVGMVIKKGGGREVNVVWSMLFIEKRLERKTTRAENSWMEVRCNKDVVCFIAPTDM